MAKISVPTPPRTQCLRGNPPSLFRRAVAFPLHSTSHPLWKAAPSRTIEVHFEAKPASHAGPLPDGSLNMSTVFTVAVENVMGTLNRTELDKLERRELQLTILATAFVLVQAAGLAMFMYPLVFLHPVGNKWTLRVAFFGFCVLTLLFVGYLLDRHRTVRKLKQQILEELERNLEPRLA